MREQESLLRDEATLQQQIKSTHEQVILARKKQRELTIRSRNLDAEAVSRINAVIRGVARYFATTFSTVTKQFENLDYWTRKRLRCMKFKRISRVDNQRLKNKHQHRLGLLSLSDFLPCSCE